MAETPNVAIAVVGLGAIMPDAPNAAKFWENLTGGRYSISDVDPDRWDPDLYYDPDPAAPDKTYSRIGGWVRDYEWDPIGWHLPVPPRVADQMDAGQKWAIYCARAALSDYGWPDRPIETERTAVIIGNALAGEKHYRTSLRVAFPEFIRELEKSAHFHGLPSDVQEAITAETLRAWRDDFDDITEDTMPGELANVIAGRVANLFDLRGPNYTTDAACASALAAITGGVEGLLTNEFDAVLTGGVDRNMGVQAFVKFCKIGALSATGTRPYGDGADGFVMGEGAALFLLKRLADAERDGDRVYAVIRGIAGSSDGRGKGITAPNPVGQRLAVERAWKEAGLSPATATLIEGHGTSTRVGDVVEVQALSDVFRAAGAEAGTIALGSVKSNLGHLKGAAGAAGMAKTVLALHHRLIPPSLHATRPNPDIDFNCSPFFVNHELCEWDATGTAGVRRAGLSAFGFGGTNFHVVLEEYVPGRLNGRTAHTSSTSAPHEAGTLHFGSGGSATDAPRSLSGAPEAAKVPLRGALVLGAATVDELSERLRRIQEDASAGIAPPFSAPSLSDLRSSERIAIDYANAAGLAANAAAALKALEAEASSKAAPLWKALRARGIAHRGSGPPPKVAFLYTGQGSQYVNMLAALREAEPIVAATFAEADRIMMPLIDGLLSERIFVDGDDSTAVAFAESALRETEITQPAVMTADLALTRLLAAYGIEPDMAMGHSLGEYGALMVAGSLGFKETLEAVSARGREMSEIRVDDRGVMAAVLAPMDEIEAAVADVDGCVLANVNSNRQGVIGGASGPVRRAMAKLSEAGHAVIELPVSHAFHTSIVAPASGPLRSTLVRLGLRAPELPIVSNVTGELYPSGPDAADTALDLLSKQVASPVQFVKGLRTLYREGARIFVEVGPKRALQGFAEDVLGEEPGVVTLFSNHPKNGDVVSFNQALCGLYAAGLGHGIGDALPPAERGTDTAGQAESGSERDMTNIDKPANYYERVGRLVDEIVMKSHPAADPSDGPARREPVVIAGASLGLPGRPHIFADDNVAAILHGNQGIDVVPSALRQAVLDKHITRLVKREGGEPSFEVIDDPEDVIKLAARGGALDVVDEYGLEAERVAAFDVTTKMAIGAGLDALRDAGIPLVLRYRTTSKGTRLPERYQLPEAIADSTGIIFASAFPGADALIGMVTEYEQDRARRTELADMRSLLARLEPSAGDEAITEIERRIHDLERAVDAHPYSFDRRFLFRVLSMGHSQLAELIGARGPNTQVNSACASTTQALTLAEDWINASRCDRVIIVAADDVTSDNLFEWVAAGFLASGAAATDDVVEEAALPFDRRRHGMLIGMGAAGIVVESGAAARSRGVTPICELVAGVTANSAFHGTRLDVPHIASVMEKLVAEAERSSAVSRHEMAGEMVFVSHETYTPARGGSASAEVEALRKVFGADAQSILIANTKGFTGHPMAVGVEDVVAVKALETGIVPPVPNFREVDPELGLLNLSLGGAYPVKWALRLAAGFGSQISMTLTRWVPSPGNVHPAPDDLGYAYRVADAQTWKSWLAEMSGQAEPALEVVKRTLRVVAHESATSGSKPVTAVSEPVVQVVGISADEAAPVPEVTAEPDSSGPEPLVGVTSVQQKVLSLVAEKTGYPEDMLDVDLDLEADLGIDTVKQAELFAVLRESYGIERDDTLRLRDLPTLHHIVDFIVSRTPLLAGSSGAPAPFGNENAKDDKEVAPARPF